MPWSHHSHSGQFCGHATDTLEEVVQDAISKQMTTFCLTEHISRDTIDFYPGEDKVHTPESLAQLYDDFHHEARRLQQKYADKIQLLIGFEGEWIRPSSLTIINSLLAKYDVDLFVGSVHHVHTLPIDYDKAFYHKAREIAGGTDHQLFQDYLDSQFEMLKALKPPVVGHFDLIRLYSDSPDQSFQASPEVWSKVLRNLQFVAEYGGVLELNSSALRKGMSESYPQVDICRTFLEMGGRFTLSDDSHGTAHVGLNYKRMLACVERAGIPSLCHLTPISSASEAQDGRFPNVKWSEVRVDELRSHAFWT